MAKQVDLSKLGLKKIPKRVFKPVQDPKTGLLNQKWVTELVEEQDPILSLEDAQKIGDEDWQPSPECMPSKFMVRVNGRRFFCDQDPRPVKKTTGDK